MLRALAFSDLDGTLLDAETFAWESARPGLDALHRRGIPLVFTSSKTRPELEAWRQRLGNTDPFISENGGALYLPADWTPMPDRADPVGGGLVRVEIGVPLNRLRVALREISAELGVALRGFGDMPRSEVAELSGLDGLGLRTLEELGATTQGARAGGGDILEPRATPRQPRKGEPRQRPRQGEPGDQVAGRSV